MQSRWALSFLLCACLAWAQVAIDVEKKVAIDLGWIAAVQQERGWIVTNAPAAPPMYKSKRILQMGDVLY
jgi:hypothetical protein